MEEFGDWIYIIIIVIAGIASFFSSMRKKAQQAEVQNQQRDIITNRRDDVDEWDDYIPKAEKIPANAVLLKQQTRKPYQSIDMYQEAIPAFAMEEPRTMETDERQTLITIEDLPADVDDWRKAFVYQEIFNRKY